MDLKIGDEVEIVGPLAEGFYNGSYNKKKFVIGWIDSKYECYSEDAGGAPAYPATSLRKVRNVTVKLDTTKFQETLDEIREKIADVTRIEAIEERLEELEEWKDKMEEIAEEPPKLEEGDIVEIVGFAKGGDCGLYDREYDIIRKVEKDTDGTMGYYTNGMWYPKVSLIRMTTKEVVERLNK